MWGIFGIAAIDEREAFAVASGVWPISFLNSPLARLPANRIGRNGDWHAAFRDGIPVPFLSRRLCELKRSLSWSRGQQEARCVNGLAKAALARGLWRETVGDSRAELCLEVLEQLLI